jgi:tetratricopeptide (TPR) repeat protein
MTAEPLFRWLWAGRPNRYQSHGNFKLKDVIDAQLSRGDRAVGNCLGLTLLYHCLLRRTGVRADGLYLENGFGKGPHVLTILDTGATSIDVENIFQNGFDYKGHLSDPSRTRWGDRELVSDIYHSLANELLEKGRFALALKNYEKAIALNPQYEKARLNRVILLDRMEMEKERRHKEPG